MTYDEFIQNIITERGRHGCGETYHERHHILPKCLGGKDTEENMIDLFAKEHYEAHRMLALENPHNQKLQFAWWSMASMKNQNEGERYICTPEEFEEARMTHSESMKGKNNPMYGSKRYGELNPMYGRKHSIETKKKLSDYFKAHPSDWSSNPYIGKSLKGPNSPCYGIKRSEEQKKHLSDAKKVVRPVMQYDLEGNFIKKFESEWEASELLNISVPCIRHSLKKIGNIAKGFIFIEYKGVVYEHIDIPEHKCTWIKAVKQYDLNGNFIAEYESIKEAENVTGCRSDMIVRCCKGKANFTRGFKWYYATE